jgi:hypothetical protein
MKTYITLVDPEGATLGYGGEFVPISHRVLFENKVFHGFESAIKVFRDHREMMELLQFAIAQPHGSVGMQGKISWTVERC